MNDSSVLDGGENGSEVKSPKKIGGAIDGVKISAVFGFRPEFQGLRMYAIDDQGNAYAWGDNYSQALGIGTSSTHPVKIQGELAGVRVEKIFPWDNATYAIDDQGNAYAWGSNLMKDVDNSEVYGALGIGSDKNISIPLPVRLSHIPEGERVRHIYTP